MLLNILNAQDNAHPLRPTNNYSAQNINSADAEELGSRSGEPRETDDSCKASLRSGRVTSLHCVRDKRFTKPACFQRGREQTPPVDGGDAKVTRY